MERNCVAELSPKQMIYAELVSLTLVYLRNRASLPWWRRIGDHSAYFELDLLHNLSNSMFEREMVEHDVWFLNAQAQYYWAQCSPKLSPLYGRQLELIQRLIVLVPDHLRNQLKWTGPTPPMAWSDPQYIASIGVVRQADDLLTAEAAPGVGHTQRNARARAAAGDGHAAIAGGVVIVEQGPGRAVELVEARGTGGAGTGLLGEGNIEHGNEARFLKYTSVKLTNSA